VVPPVNTGAGRNDDPVVMVSPAGLGCSCKKPVVEVGVSRLLTEPKKRCWKQHLFFVFVPVNHILSKPVGGFSLPERHERRIGIRRRTAHEQSNQHSLFLKADV
jgi:hypothetical protein